LNAPTRKFKLDGSATEYAVSPEVASYVTSGVSAFLDGAEVASVAPETQARPVGTFNGATPPTARAKAERIAAGEQASIHLVADVQFGDGRCVLCSCGFWNEGARSDRAMADAFWNHSR
jgi:hypothetical protein